MLSPVSQDEILKHIGYLSIRNVMGLDGLSARFLKYGASVFAFSFAHIINLSLDAFKLCPG